MNKLNLTKGKIIGYIIALVGIALSEVLIVLLNSFDKVELVSTDVYKRQALIFRNHIIPHIYRKNMLALPHHIHRRSFFHIVTADKRYILSLIHI